MMKLFKKIVDERQELELMRIEHIGFWVLFWGLLIAIHVQLFVYGLNFQQIAGEFILLAISAVVVLIGCLNKGLWSYRIKPTVKSNLLCSLIGAIVFSLLSAAIRYKKLSATKIVFIGDLMPLVIVRALILFAVYFAVYSICATIANKRKAKLETYFDENGNE